MLIRRVIDLRAALKLGVRIGLDDIHADEFQALLILDEERNRWEATQVESRNRSA